MANRKTFTGEEGARIEGYARKLESHKVRKEPDPLLKTSREDKAKKMSSSAVAKSSKYTYRSTGGGTADVSIEYSADLSALSRLEVGPAKKMPLICPLIGENDSRKIKSAFLNGHY